MIRKFVLGGDIWLRCDGLEKDSFEKRREYCVCKSFKWWILFKGFVGGIVFVKVLKLYRFWYVCRIVVKLV